MKNHNKWSFTPYSPLFFETGDIYISRIVPGENFIYFEWLSNDKTTYSVFCKKRSQDSFIHISDTTNKEFHISNLDANCDYEFFVSSGDKKSRIRLARTGLTVGTVVNYLHPDDDVYSFSGKYLCSPSLLKHPDGYLLSSMDVYANSAPQNLTLIFRSDDGGSSWHYVSELMPCFWGKMFIHNGDVYMLACSTEYGDLLISKSSDGAKTFSSPVVLLRGSGGKGGKAGVHKNPQPVISFMGRIYNTLEWGSWSEHYHAPMVMSADENSDLLNPESWEFSNPIKYNPAWPGVAKGESTGNIEGTLAISPDNKLYNIMRYDMTKTIPNYGMVIAYEVDTSSPSAPLKFSHTINFPANHSKFMIKRDPVSKYYYSLASRITEKDKINDRRLLSLMKSKDLNTWEVEKDIIDGRNYDHKKVGFQYVDFEFDGDDIIFICRTAMNGSHSFHDSNYQTFHRIENFRNI